MRKRALTVAALAIAFLLGSVTGSRLTRVGAQAVVPDSPQRLEKQGAIPGSWGDLKAATSDFLVFEDRSGNLRMMNINGWNWWLWVRDDEK